MFFQTLNPRPLTHQISPGVLTQDATPAISTSTVRALLLLLVAPVLALLLTTSQAAAVQSNAGDPPDPTGQSFLLEANSTMTDWVMTFHDDGTWDLVKPDGTLVGYGTYIWDPMTGSLFYENDSPDGGGGQYGEYEWNYDEMRWDRVFSSHPKAPEVSLYEMDFI